MKPKTVGRIADGTPSRIPSDTTGLLAHSIILTLDGAKPVGHVQAGDRVITRDSGMAIVKAVHRRQIRTAAVRIAAGSLGQSRPDRDVTLPARQMVLMRDWRAQALFGKPQALIPVSSLVDGEFIRLQDDVPMTVCDLEFDRPHILYVDGIEVAGHFPQTATAASASAAA